MLLTSLSIFGFSNEGVYKTNNSVGELSSVMMTNGIYDEIYIQSSPTYTFTTDLDNWTSSTVLLAKFHNNLSGGNVSVNGLTVEYLIVKRRKINTLIWETVVSIPFDKTIRNYEIFDRLVEANEEYEYAVVPATLSVEGEYAVGNIETNFIGSFLFDNTHNYRLFYNFELGDVDCNFSNSTIEVLGNTYPIVMYSSNVNYKSGSVKAALISDTSASQYNIDPIVEKVYRKGLKDFLTNKKPKILKSMDGLYSLISIVGTPKLKPYNQLNGFIYDIDFNWVEVGATDYSTLLAAGIIVE